MISAPEKVLMICSQLRVAGYSAWLVGGAVRDSIRGREPHDWDIATNARPNRVAGLFPRVVETGIKHGTVTVIVDGEPFEVTTFRGDGAYTDGRRPDSVTFLDTIEEDLARRDFTINAIAYDPLKGQFSDPYGGRDDLDAGLIRAVGRAEERFREDGLRILRGARFAATLDFEIDVATARAMTAELDVLRGLAQERIHDEWAKALTAERPSTFFRVMHLSGMLDYLCPELVPLIGCEQNRYHQYDVWDHTLAVLDATSVDPVLRLAAVFHDVSKPATKGTNEKTGDVTFYDHENVGAGVADGILERMRFSTEHRQRAVHLIRHHLIPYQRGWAGAAIRRWVRRVGAENVAPLLQLGRADIAGKGQATIAMRADVLDELERRIAEMEIKAPIVTNTAALAINGADVMAALDIPAGKRVGDALRHLLELVTEDPELNTRERLLQSLVTLAGRHQAVES
jgi:tRNA nucleotidyltransferase (CCA-adding enzyme)